MPAIGQPLPPRQKASALCMPADTTLVRPTYAVSGGGERNRSFALRPVTLSDAGPIALLEQRLFPDEAWDLAMVREEITHPSRRYVAVVDENDEIVGYAGIMMAGDIADLHTIGTCVEGAGIGRALLTWCEEKAAAGGAERLLLEVRVDNTRARMFYDRANFTELGIRKGYYQTSSGAIDAVVMEKNLHRV